MPEVYNNDNPLTMKKLAVRLDSIEETLAGLAGNSSTDTDARVVDELRRLADAEVEANRRRTTMTATHITRIVLEMIVVITLCAFAMGCTSEFPGLIIGPVEGGSGSGVIDLPDMEHPVVPGPAGSETVTPDVPEVPDGGHVDVVPTEPESDVKSLSGTFWKCAPVVVERMEVIRIEFNETGDAGVLIFLARGREMEREITVSPDGLELHAPESLWSYETDYKDSFNVVTSEGISIDFARMTD